MMQKEGKKLGRSGARETKEKVIRKSSPPLRFGRGIFSNFFTAFFHSFPPGAFLAIFFILFYLFLFLYAQRQRE